MSTENVILYILLPCIGWVMIRVNSIEKKVTALRTRLDVHLKEKTASDTDRIFR